MITKYQINQPLYINGCPKHYQLKNIFVPKFIKKSPKTLITENGIFNSIDVLYSENGIFWFPESNLTTELNTK